jgi:hypothetical protein
MSLVGLSWPSVFIIIIVVVAISRRETALAAVELLIIAVFAAYRPKYCSQN